MRAYDPAAEPEPSGAWCDDDLLVVTLGCELPDHCIFCDAMIHEPHARLKVGPAAAGAVLAQVALPVYLAPLAAPVPSGGFGVRLPLCPEHRWERRSLVVWAWTICLAGIATATISVLLRFDALAILGGIFALHAGLVALLSVPRIGAEEIIDGYAWIRGASPAFLARLSAY